MADTSAPRTLVELFEAVAEQFAQHPAVSDEHRQLTYRELHAAAHDLAAELMSRSVGPECPVGVHMPRGVAAVAAMLGVLLAGGAYVPIDVDYPLDRREEMLTGAGVALVVCVPGGADRLRGLPVEALQWDATASDRGPRRASSPGPAQAACVLFTSGSTGRPKGVVLEHRQMTSFALDPTLPALRPGDRTAQAASVSFDTLTFDVWRTLAGGAEIVVMPSFAELAAGDLRRDLRRKRITAMLAPAMVVSHVVRHDRGAFSSLRLLCSGGDVLLSATCRELRAGGYRGALFNLYGPTETTVACTGQPVGDADDEFGSRVPIGHAFANARLYVLDDALKPVPDGSPGELFVAGEGVGRGYLARPDATAERFRPDPFAANGSRMYATGDRVRRAVDGALEFLGRVDSQVKISGVRVEPGEVERALCRHPDVADAAVLAVGDVQKQLVAFVVPARPQLKLRAVRAHLTEALPRALVPAQLFVVLVMPTDLHGKRDWAELASQAADDSRRRTGFRPPRTPQERYLASLWEDLLGVEAVGVKDDFFALGGHSLLAVRARLQMQRDLQVQIPTEAVFENGVLEDLARTVTDALRTVDAP